MVLEAYVLGTSGSIPLPRRALSSVMLRCDGETILFDCGEGMQIGLRNAGLSWKKLQVICISHSHADHVTGLPGLIMLSAQAERTEPLTIVCPAAVCEFLEQARKALGMYIPFKIEYVILEQLAKKSIVYHNKEDTYYIRAFPGMHTRKVWGFAYVEQERPGRFNVEQALQLQIPQGPLWSQLQRGEDVRVGAKVYHPHDVLGAPRPGRKVVYITDTRPMPSFVSELHGSDMVFIEGMFKDEHAEIAKEKLHLTGTEAAQMLQKAGGVERAGLLHFSPRYTYADIEEIEKEAQQIFPQLQCCRERQHFLIEYKKEI